MKNQELVKRIINALNGIQHAWQGERSFRTHVVIGSAVIIFFLWWRLPTVWWALIIISIMLVLAAELVNSSIEALADHLHPQFHPSIGKVKDIGAGMVLVMVIAAILIGILAVLSNPHVIP